MSRNHSDAYVKFSAYNAKEAQQAPVNPRFANAPPPADLSNNAPADPRFANGPPPVVKQNPVDNRYANTPPQTHPDVFNPPVQHRVREIESEKLFQLLRDPNYQLTKAGKPVKIFVKVYTDWCAPCKKIAPLIQELSVQQENAEILFVQINGEKICKKLETVIKVGAVPVFFGFVKGVKMGDFVAGADRDKIIELCNNLAKA